jgi:hypothetical protein
MRSVAREQDPRSPNRSVSPASRNNMFRGMGHKVETDRLNFDQGEEATEGEEIEYIEVERPMIIEKIIDKEIIEEVYVNIPQIVEVIKPIYVDVPVEQYVEVIEILPPPVPEVPAEYKKILAEGCAKLALMMLENRRLHFQLEHTRELKEQRIAFLKKHGRYRPGQEKSGLQSRTLAKSTDRKQEATQQKAIPQKVGQNSQEKSSSPNHRRPAQTYTGMSTNVETKERNVHSNNEHQAHQKVSHVKRTEATQISHHKISNVRQPETTQSSHQKVSHVKQPEISQISHQKVSNVRQPETTQISHEKTYNVRQAETTRIPQQTITQTQPQTQLNPPRQIQAHWPTEAPKTFAFQAPITQTVTSPKQSFPQYEPSPQGSSKLQIEIGNINRMNGVLDKSPVRIASNQQPTVIPTNNGPKINYPTSNNFSQPTTFSGLSQIAASPKNNLGSTPFSQSNQMPWTANQPSFSAQSTNISGYPVTVGNKIVNTPEIKGLQEVLRNASPTPLNRTTSIPLQSFGATQSTRYEPTNISPIVSNIPLANNIPQLSQSYSSQPQQPYTSSSAIQIGSKTVNTPEIKGLASFVSKVGSAALNKHVDTTKSTASFDRAPSSSNFAFDGPLKVTLPNQDQQTSRQQPAHLQADRHRY